MGCRHSHHSKSSHYLVWTHASSLLPCRKSAGVPGLPAPLGTQGPGPQGLTGAKSPPPYSAEAAFEVQEVDTGTPTPLWGLRCLPGCLQHMLESVPWDATMENNEETRHHEQQPVNNRYENKVGKMQDYQIQIITQLSLLCIKT